MLQFIRIFVKEDSPWEIVLHLNALFVEKKTTSELEIKRNILNVWQLKNIVQNVIKKRIIRRRNKEDRIIGLFY